MILYSLRRNPLLASRWGSERPAIMFIYPLSIGNGLAFGQNSPKWECFAFVPANRA